MHSIYSGHRGDNEPRLPWASTTSQSLGRSRFLHPRERLSHLTGAGLALAGPLSFSRRGSCGCVPQTGIAYGGTAGGSAHGTRILSRLPRCYVDPTTQNFSPMKADVGLTPRCRGPARHVGKTRLNRVGDATEAGRSTSSPTMSKRFNT